METTLLIFLTLLLASLVGALLAPPLKPIPVKAGSGCREKADDSYSKADDFYS